MTSSGPSAARRGRPPPGPSSSVLKWTTARFAERGLASPAPGRRAAGRPRLRAAAGGPVHPVRSPAVPGELARFRELVKRRQAGEPVAYLTGRKQFWSLELAVDHRVLVPRPDTETAVEAALDLCRPRPADRGTRRPERSAGGGTERRAAPDAQPPTRSEQPGSERKLRRTARQAGPSGRPCDVPPARPCASPTSAPDRGRSRWSSRKSSRMPRSWRWTARPTRWTWRGATPTGSGLAVTFAQGDLLEPLAGQPPFDLIVANLPYVPSGDIAALAPEVRSEPLLALDGGADGLALVRRLVAGVGRVLRPGGALVLEVGMGQADAVAELARAAGFDGRADPGGSRRRSPGWSSRAGRRRWHDPPARDALALGDRRWRRPAAWAPPSGARTRWCGRPACSTTTGAGRRWDAMTTAMPREDAAAFRQPGRRTSRTSWSWPTSRSPR